MAGKNKTPGICHLMLLDGLVRELGGGEQTHRLQRQVSQVRFPVAQELTQLVASANEKVGFAEMGNNNLIS